MSQFSAEVELSMGERVDIPYQLQYKGSYIYTLYITTEIESELMKLIQVKHPDHLASAITAMIKAQTFHIRINEEEEYLLVSYNGYTLGGRVYANNGGVYVSSLSKSSF